MGIKLMNTLFVFLIINSINVIRWKLGTRCIFTAMALVDTPSKHMDFFFIILVAVCVQRIGAQQLPRIITSNNSIHLVVNDNSDIIISKQQSDGSLSGAVDAC